MSLDTKAPLEGQGSILYVDAHDSFANNIVALLETTLGVHVTIVQINAPLPDLPKVLASFDAVIMGPGPGDPSKSEDFELFKRIWEMAERDCVPVLGICLGFQSLAIRYGATLERLTNPKHGIITDIHHCEGSIFDQLRTFDVTQYHSLRVKIKHPIEESRRLLRPIELWNWKRLWSSTTTCPDLQPLAWDVDDSENGGVLMALKHTELPFWGIQFHPESICSSRDAIKVVVNWWLQAVEYNDTRGRSRTDGCMSMDTLDRNDIFGLPRDFSLLQRAAHWKSLLPSGPVPPAYSKPKRPAPRKVRTAKLEAGYLRVTDLCEELGTLASQSILLESVVSRPEVGRYSIIGLIVPDDTQILEHKTGESFVDITIAKTEHSNELVRKHKLGAEETMWDFLADHMEKRKAIGGSASSPFWGGLMGYLSYESRAGMNGCNESCAANNPNTGSNTAFADVERSIVLDHLKGKVYIQSLKSHDGEWMKSTKAIVKKLVVKAQVIRMTPEQVTSVLGHLPQQYDKLTSESELRMCKHVIDQERFGVALDFAHIDRPKEEEYREKVRRCQEHIRAGETYELCLTDQAVVILPKDSLCESSWQLYKALRHINPAPFAAHLRVSGATIVSGSPERFLSWNRDGVCQLRPIKGTVKKAPGIDKHDATQILSQPKEQAENLMIVDLIRHDLHAIVGAGKVEVKKLMSVEEYQTVYQLVSVIEGRLPELASTSSPISNPKSNSKPEPKQNQTPRTPPNAKKPQPQQSPTPPFRGYTGLDVLHSAFPPGSMTGAPKLRSCALLHTLEHHQPRGLYSGAIGYMCAGGGGDFSVLIRCAYRHDNEVVTTHASDGRKVEMEIWRVGAGGAITALSEDGAEWEEMGAKLDSTLAAFVAGAGLTEKQKLVKEVIRRMRAENLELLS
ncbi:MAG: para-aminobenzoate synthase, (PABA) [Pleopsidium flavum]|nr:MAG: para-aminobenzoate synthase, (PABA) [Pleopsidium flavum]